MAQPSGCPVDHSAFTNPPAPAAPAAPAAPTAPAPTAAPTAAPVMPDSCPVAHQPSTSPTPTPSSATATTPAAAECPVKKPAQRKVYNVYAQLIDPSNQMPANPNQEPAPNQRIPLSTERVKSNIPKGGTDADTWLYPSEQMFFNALRRKGKDDGFQEESAEVVVAIHNNMNERTWNEVMKWEKQHCNECAEPKLLKFMGRPEELSPKARLKTTLLGWVTPFDRHDWIVDRCGKEVRYVIDYYFDEGSAHLDQKPELTSSTKVKSIHVDVRPALDSVESVIDRLRNFPQRMKAAMERDKDGNRFTVSQQQKVNAQRKPVEEKLRSDFEEIKTRCAKNFKAASTCQGEEACEKARIAVNYCMASVVCQEQSKAFMQAMESGQDEAVVQGVYTAMEGCIRKFGAALQNLD